MSVVTDTTNHENGSRGDSRIAPTGDWTGVIFRGMTGAGVIEGSPKAGASSLYLSPDEGEILAACRVVADTLHGPLSGRNAAQGEPFTLTPTLSRERERGLREGLRKREWRKGYGAVLPDWSPTKLIHAHGQQARGLCGANFVRGIRALMVRSPTGPGLRVALILPKKKGARRCSTRALAYSSNGRLLLESYHSERW